jgi:hypothetical protein
MISPKVINLKLYLEGVEFPIHSVQIIEQQGVSGRCSFIIPATDSALHIEPRTLVHLFYKDTYTNDKWLLIFEGEISGINLNKTSDQRTITVDAVTLVDHWNFATKEGQGIGAGGYKGQYTTRVSMTFSKYSSPSDKSSVYSDIKAFTEVIDQVDTSSLPESLQETAEATSSFIGPEITQASIDIGTELGTIGLDGILLEILTKNRGKTALIAKLIARVLNEFAKANVGYSVFHVVYKMVSRLVDFENKSVESILRANVGDQFLSGLVQNTPSQISLLSMMYNILEAVNYKIINPTAPTYNEDTGAPMSFMFIPTPTLFTPLSCNTIFKDEVISSSFNRNYLTEPTRLAGRMYPVSGILAGASRVTDSLVISPSSQLTYDPNDSSPTTILMTREERLRGIYGQISTLDFDELKARDDARAKFDGDSEESIAARKKYVEEVTKKYTDMQYQLRVLENRSFSLTTTYSPYRICGLPGIFVDDKLPSIVGTISSISSSINADGSATSIVHFSYPRPLQSNNHINTRKNLKEVIEEMGYEGEEIDNDLKSKLWPFSDKQEFMLYTEPDKITLGNGFGSGSKDHLVLTEYLKYRLDHKEDFVFLNSWYDADKYFSNTIGKKIYKKIVYGIDDEFPEKETYFGAIDDTYDGSFGKISNNADIYFGFGLNNNIEYTSFLGFYLSSVIQGMGAYSNNIREFIEKFTRRNIITEDKYWEFFVGEGVATPGDQVRSISASIGAERKFIKETFDGKKNVPFIKERQVIIKKLLREIKNV